MTKLVGEHIGVNLPELGPGNDFLDMISITQETKK